MNTRFLLSTGIASITLAASSAALAGPPAMAADGVLVSPSGMSLYIFDRDPAGGGKSLCNGGCATNWPPLMAAADAAAMGDWTIVTRDNGAKQWAFKGKPVYAWSKDIKPGDRMGDGFNNLWHLARP